MRGGIQAVLRAMETFPDLPNLQVGPWVVFDLGWGPLLLPYTEAEKRMNSHKLCKLVLLGLIQ